MVVWVGIPILLVVAGAWWLFGAFERLQAHYLLRANVPPAPREWERVEGIWAQAQGALRERGDLEGPGLPARQASLRHRVHTLLVTAGAMVFWFVAMPFFSVFDVPVINGTWVPPLWFGLLCLPLGILVFFVALHVLNGWSWVCARWAEVMFSGPAPRAAAPPAPAPQYAAALRRRRGPRPPRLPSRRRPRLIRLSPAPAPAAPAGPADPADDETTS